MTNTRISTLSKSKTVAKATRSLVIVYLSTYPNSMSIIKILQYPDSGLKRTGVKVEDVKDPRIQKIIKDIFESLANAKNCAALAATQLDIPDAPAITVINSYPPEYPQPFCVINPEILESEGEEMGMEGCMSVAPEYVSAMVKRAARVKVKMLNQEGEEIIIEADGFMARCLQHEIDHLNGIIYLDRLSSLKRSRVEKKLEKIKNY